MKKLLALFILFSFLSCKQEPKVLPVNTMKLVMLDMVTADEWIKIRSSQDSMFMYNKQNISYYNKIFSQYKISKDNFYNSYKYYQQHPLEMKELMDSLTNYANKKRDTIINHIEPAQPKAKVEKAKIKN